MEIRKFNLDLYNEILLPWFAGYDWTPVPKTALPKTSYCVYINNRPVAYSCYYGSSVDFAVIGYTISNPYVEVPEEAISSLLAYVITEAKKDGYSYLHYSTGKTGVGLVRKLKKLGMQVTCSHGYIMGMSLNNNDISFLQEE